LAFGFVVPDADDRTFVYGLNFETSYNAKRWDTRRITEEMRPIIGFDLQGIAPPVLLRRLRGRAVVRTRGRRLD
jgi:hypothetical protein